MRAWLTCNITDAEGNDEVAAIAALMFPSHVSTRSNPLPAAARRRPRKTQIGVATYPEAAYARETSREPDAPVALHAAAARPPTLSMLSPRKLKRPA